jgi:hypothetical protein
MPTTRVSGAVAVLSSPFASLRFRSHEIRSFRAWLPDKDIDIGEASVLAKLMLSRRFGRIIEVRA